MMAELLAKNDHGVMDRPGLLQDGLLQEIGLDGAELNDVNVIDASLVGLDPASLLRARSALARSRIYDLRRLVVTQVDNSIVLRGRVSSFYHKQLAQEIVRNAADGAVVVNALRVVYHADRRDSDLERAG